MAIAIALLLHAAAFLPFALAAWRPALLPAIMGIAVSVILALIFVQSGAVQRGQLASTDVSHLFTGDAFSDRCEQVIDALVQAGVAARPGPEGFIVNGAAWDQLPKTIQDPVLSCAQQLADPDAPPGQIELIRR